MGNIPAQSSGSNGTATGDNPEFAELAGALRQYVGLRGAVDSGAHNEHLAALMRITTLMHAKPHGYETEVLRLAMPVLSHRNADIGILARVCLAVGKIHLIQLNEHAPHHARLRLEQAWAYATTLSGPMRDPMLIVEISTQLALATHRLGDAGSAKRTMEHVRAIIDEENFTDETLKRGAEQAYGDTANLLSVQ